MPEDVARLSPSTTSPTRSSPRRCTGTDGTDARIGLIGEIGVSSDFTAEPRSNPCAARRVRRRAPDLPLMVHLPGWFRLGHRVLDIVEEEGADLRHTVLCHMNPSHDDFAYQAGRRRRGAPSSNST